MPSLLNPCDPDRLQLLVEDRLNPAEMAGLEQHLEQCVRCRDTLDHMVEDDQHAGAVRHYLADETELLSNPTPKVEETLDFLAPSDWPDSLGRLGTYEIKGVLGRGGMGIVLKAFDPALSRNVAIKVMSASLASCGVARQRFLREARAAAAVVHEHVVAVFAVVEAAGLPFLVMEYVPGRSLQDRLDKHGPLSLAETLRIGMQTAAGLAAAHAQGLVHRDVKPANILLEEGIERVRLTDFGLARAVADATMTHSGTVAGTPHYMAPEQARGDTTDHRADLFSLGSTLYATCSGYPPFRAEMPLAVLRRVIDDQPRPLRAINPEVPEWLEAVINRLLAKDPTRRYQTAAEVADLLERCLAHVQQPLGSPLPRELKVSPVASRKRMIRRSAAIVTLVAGVLFVPIRGLLPKPGSNAMTAPSPLVNLEQEPTVRPISVVPDEIQRLLDEASARAGAVRAEIFTRSADCNQDPIAEQSAALSRRVEALEREMLSPNAPSSVPAFPFTNPRPRIEE